MGFIKKRTLRKKKVVRRRVARRSRVQKVQTFKRSVYIPNWINTLTVSDTAFQFNPQLSDVPDHSEFTKLYDQYCIKGVNFKLVPRFNVNQALPTGTIPGLPPSQIMSCFDYDGQAPTSIQAILQYPSLRMTRGTSIHTRYLKPACLNMAYQSTVATAYVPKWGQFIDTSNDTVPWYGIAGMIPSIGVTYSYDLIATYYLAFKNPK